MKFSLRSLLLWVTLIGLVLSLTRKDGMEDAAWRLDGSRVWLKVGDKVLGPEEWDYVSNYPSFDGYGVVKEVRRKWASARWPKGLAGGLQSNFVLVERQERK